MASTSSAAVAGGNGNQSNADENEDMKKNQPKDELKNTLIDTVLTLEKLDVNLFRLVSSRRTA